MNEQNQQIIEQLTKCADIEDKIQQKQSNIRTKEQEIHNMYVEKRTFKTLKKHIIILSALFLVALITSIIFTVSAISASNAWKKANDVISYPGSAYEEWLDSWADYNEFEELEPGWQAVQEDWKERGLEVSWEYVCDVWASSNSKQDQFKSRLKDSLNEDYASKLFTNYYVSVIIAVICIPTSIALAYSLNKNYKELKKSQKELAQAEKDAIIKNSEIISKCNKELNKLNKQQSEVVAYMRDNFGIERGNFLQEKYPNLW